jgi:hypothetical protein
LRTRKHQFAPRSLPAHSEDRILTFGDDCAPRLIAAIAFAVHGASPPGLLDLVVGINQWSYRLVVYVALMTDRYPQFRLDQRSIDVEVRRHPRPWAGASLDHSAAEA